LLSICSERDITLTEAIEKPEMPIGIKQPLMLVLTMQIADSLADLLERG
jgi:hypothetical protein